MTIKKIHRIYFGFDGKPDPYLEYLESWSKQLPDFEIIHWNSKNLPIDNCEYSRKLFELQDHAFLSDYFRWYLLNEYGGIYLDADIEIINGDLFSKIIEELEDNESLDSFIGIDEMNGGWFTAHSMASKPKSDISHFMRKTYESMSTIYLWRRKDFYLMAPQLTGLYFTSLGFNVDGMGTAPGLASPEIRYKTKIYPQDWFSPVTPNVSEGSGGFTLTGLSENTCLCHHFSGSWHTKDSLYAAAIAKRGGKNLLLNDYLEANPGSRNRYRKITKFARILSKIWINRKAMWRKLKDLSK